VTERPTDVTETAPGTPEDLANAETGQTVYVGFTETDGYGVRSISGRIISSHENDDPDDHARTVTVRDEQFGVFDFILNYDAKGEIVLSSGIEANTHTEGYTVLEIDDVEDLEIHDRELRADGGECLGDAVDHERNCAACGVYPRADGSRLCDHCRDALVRCDGGETQQSDVESAYRSVTSVVRSVVSDE